MNVSVIGTGYVGLVSGVCLASKGHIVKCVDIDRAKVDKINEGIPPIYEVGLEELLKSMVGRNMFATTDLHAAVLDSELTLIAVGTPFDGNEIDLKYIREVSRQIGEVLMEKQSYHVVVVKSTVVPGTTDDVVLPILEMSSGKKAGKDFGVGMNPEFLTEGQAIADFMNPDRIVLGGIDQRSIDILGKLYTVFSETPKLQTNCKTAEMIKYTSNAMLATAISFANEIGNLCSAIGGIDVVDVMAGLHLSSYLRPQSQKSGYVQAPISSFYQAGCGFGGSCLPKDVKALISHGKKAGSPMPLLQSVIDTNLAQPMHIRTILGRNFETLKRVRIAVLGLAFKPDTDDIRETPAIPIIKKLIEDGADVSVFDHVAMAETKKVFDGMKVRFALSMENCIENVEAIILVTRWKEFELLPQIIKNRIPQPLVVDGRRQLDKNSVARYTGIGL